MRIQLFGSSLLAVAALVGCGGDDGHIKVPDAKVFKDSAIDAPHMCLSMASLGSGSVGTMAAPIAATNTGMTWFYKNMTTMTIYFGIAVRMSPMTDPAPDVAYFIVDEPTTGGFLANVPYNWITDPTSMATGAVSFLDTDVDSSNNTTQELWPQGGGITFSKVSKLANQDEFATVSMTTYKEIDDNGALVAGGCQSVLTGLNLYLHQANAAPARLAPPSDTTGETPNGVANAIPVHDRAEMLRLMKENAVQLTVQ